MYILIKYILIEIYTYLFGTWIKVYKKYVQYFTNLFGLVKTYDIWPKANQMQEYRWTLSHCHLQCPCFFAQELELSRWTCCQDLNFFRPFSSRAHLVGLVVLKSSNLSRAFWEVSPVAWHLFEETIYCSNPPSWLPHRSVPNSCSSIFWPSWVSQSQTALEFKFESTECAGYKGADKNPRTQSSQCHP